jgi:hypothetical protein
VILDVLIVIQGDIIMRRSGIAADWEDYLPNFEEYKPDREFAADFNRIKSVIVQVAQLPIDISTKNSVLF